jgi:hypothetical protein
MTEAQVACLDLLCEVFHGEHHAPDRIFAFGRGIKCSVYGSQMATFDFDYLTRLVILAHDRCIRVEIVPSGPGRVGLALFKRNSRDGSTFERHPTMEQALAKFRTPTAPASPTPPKPQQENL